MTRALISSLLAAVLLVSAVGAGVARGYLPQAHAITICSGHGVVTILVDADGETVEQRVLCPDCIFKLLTALPPWAAEGWHLALPAAISQLSNGLGIARLPATWLPEARGPPAAARA
ncbi:MAG: hypothetical protein AAGG09_15400 [Pseudomonadota bacterium]